LSAANFKSRGTLKGVVVEIKGLEGDAAFMKAESIERQITTLIGPLSKHTVGDVSTDVIERVLSKNPFIRDVEVYVSGNGELTAQIVQRVPIVRVMSPAGKSFYLDTQGKRMPASTEYTPHVHLITGSVGEASAEDLLPLVEYIRNDVFLNAFVGQIHCDAGDDVILVPTVGHARILFGEPDRIAEKFENLKAFYTEVIAEIGWEHYRSIDLRFRNQIICKKNPTS
jgi:cell division protein FtsQ